MKLLKRKRAKDTVKCGKSQIVRVHMTELSPLDAHPSE